MARIDVDEWRQKAQELMQNAGEKARVAKQAIAITARLGVEETRDAAKLAAQKSKELAQEARTLAAKHGPIAGKAIQQHVIPIARHSIDRHLEDPSAHPLESIARGGGRHGGLLTEFLVERGIQYLRKRRNS